MTTGLAIVLLVLVIFQLLGFYVLLFLQIYHRHRRTERLLDNLVPEKEDLRALARRSYDILSGNFRQSGRDAGRSDFSSEDVVQETLRLVRNKLNIDRAETFQNFEERLRAAAQARDKEVIYEIESLARELRDLKASTAHWEQSFAEWEHSLTRISRIVYYHNIDPLDERKHPSSEARTGDLRPSRRPRPRLIFNLVMQALEKRRFVKEIWPELKHSPDPARKKIDDYLRSVIGDNCGQPWKIQFDRRNGAWEMVTIESGGRFGERLELKFPACSVTYHPSDHSDFVWYKDGEKTDARICGLWHLAWRVVGDRHLYKGLVDVNGEVPPPIGGNFGAPN